jgi:transaldolase
MSTDTPQTNLHRLYRNGGQSPWLDDLTRDLVTGDGLQKLIASGIRGVTANPTILANAIAGSGAYDEPLRALVRAGHTVEDAYWSLVVEDITAAADILRRLHTDSGGDDGFVSLELDPALAYDAPASGRAAQELRDRIGRPNALVKIPATEAGITAIRDATAAGVSVNVTLIFSLERYAQVLDAYLSGLEAFVAVGGDAGQVHSVASFFISRVDAEVERRFSASGTTVPPRLLGRVAIAQARLAYDTFRRSAASERWLALAHAGAHLQKPLWASTSTKNAALPDTLYVDQLIGPDTVTTLPETTIEAFNDHGTVQRTIDLDLDDAHRTLADAGEAGIDLIDVGLTLEDRGVASFGCAFDRVLTTMRGRVDGGTRNDGAHAA